MRSYRSFPPVGPTHRPYRWMAEATHSGIPALARFAHGLQADLTALKAGLTLEWSHGIREGHVHRLKLVKRQGYGRAGFALLRQRVWQAAQGWNVAYHKRRRSRMLWRDPHTAAR
jgi:hypothetical protein